jgi:dolichyl-phosphate beta-glucosyltransferase
MKRSSNTSRPVLISVLVPAHDCPEILEQSVSSLVFFFSTHYPNQYEIILIPNPVPGDIPTLRAARKLARRYRQVRVCPTASQAGKGAALKEGFQMSRGRWIFIIDADIPFDLEFFRGAERMLKLGFDLVIGNRRLPFSKFRMPKRVIHKVFQRFLIGYLYNLFIRLVFPIRTTDTQAGIKAMTRETAAEVFRRQICPGFSYDIEMILTTQGTGRRIAVLPVVLYLRSEKSTVRILRTAFTSAYWLTRIFLRYWKGSYSRATPS